MGVVIANTAYKFHKKYAQSYNTFVSNILARVCILERVRVHANVCNSRAYTATLTSNVFPAKQDGNRQHKDQHHARRIHDDDNDRFVIFWKIHVR